MTIAGRTVATAATIALALPAAAQAAVKDVSMGEPASTHAKFAAYTSDVDNFFPQSITIRAGDSIRFVESGFHTVDLPAKGGNAQVLLGSTGQTISGETDGAGDAFWFDGLPQAGFNPALLKTQFGKRPSYSGAARIDSGLPLTSHPQAMIVRFTKPGSFTYFCDVHPGMQGTVRVVARGRTVPTPRADAARVARQIKSAVAVSKRLATATRGPRDPLTIGIGAVGPHGVEYLGFKPDSLTVTPGATITFRIAAGSHEQHTATTGPGNPGDRTSFLGRLSASLYSPVFIGAAIYPSENPLTGAGALSPALHGNGFWNSGAMDSLRSSLPTDTSNVTFRAPGTYHFFCLIHPFMHATVTVQ